MTTHFSYNDLVSMCDLVPHIPCPNWVGQLFSLSYFISIKNHPPLEDAKIVQLLSYLLFSLLSI